MRLEIASSCGGVAALGASNRLLSWVGEHVSLEDTSCCTGVVALFANKRLLSTVNHHVHFQMIIFFPKWNIYYSLVFMKGRTKHVTIMRPFERKDKTCYNYKAFWKLTVEQIQNGKFMVSGGALNEIFPRLKVMPRLYNLIKMHNWFTSILHQGQGDV